jgi:hypothetical protein
LPMRGAGTPIISGLLCNSAMRAGALPRLRR